MMFQVLLKLILVDGQSFADIKQWIDYVREERGFDVLCVLFANIIDIEQRYIINQFKFAKEQELYYEVSAKEGTSVQQTFKNIALKLFSPIQNTDQPNSHEVSYVIITIKFTKPLN